MKYKVLVLKPDNNYELLEMEYSPTAIKQIVDSTPSIHMATFFPDGALASQVDPKWVDNIYKIATELGMEVTAFAGKYCTDREKV